MGYKLKWESFYALVFWGQEWLLQFFYIIIAFLIVQMEMVFQQAITDAQLCGARFVDLSGNSFGVTGYDLGEIIIFSKQQQDS